MMPKNRPDEEITVRMTRVEASALALASCFSGPRVPIPELERARVKLREAADGPSAAESIGSDRTVSKDEARKLRARLAELKAENVGLKQYVEELQRDNRELSEARARFEQLADDRWRGGNG